MCGGHFTPRSKLLRRPRVRTRGKMLLKLVGLMRGVVLFDTPMAESKMLGTNRISMKRSGHGGAREGAGRKPTENARTTLLQLKVSAEAMARVQARAAAAGRSVADWVRREIGAE